MGMQKTSSNVRLACLSVGDTEYAPRPVTLQARFQSARDESFRDFDSLSFQGLGSCHQAPLQAGQILGYSRGQKLGDLFA